MLFKVTGHADRRDMELDGHQHRRLITNNPGAVTLPALRVGDAVLVFTK